MDVTDYFLVKFEGDTEECLPVVTTTQHETDKDDRSVA